MQKDDWLVMDFPAQPPISCNVTDEIVKAFGKVPIDCLRSEDYIVVFETESDILSIKPDIDYLKKLDLRGVIITARSKQYDFVSRFLCTKVWNRRRPCNGLRPYPANTILGTETGQNKNECKTDIKPGRRTCV